MKISSLIISSFVSLLILGQFIIGGSVYADSADCGTSTSINANCLPEAIKIANHSTIAIILTIVFAIVGSVATLIIVLAGLKFITSSGKPEEVAKAKDTIIYAAVGLIVCIFAVTIVSFVAGFIK
jgi:ABC-type Fe3+ transport system permease subunit